jgi:hypothetical protein
LALDEAGNGVMQGVDASVHGALDLHIDEPREEPLA